ncbi:MAG TPA: hypothetical protein VF026_25585 [Ktedonobacteraceae bacterium]
MVNHKLLRLSAALVLIGGALVTVVADFLHPGGGTTYEATLAIWATSWDWTAIHLGQFVGMAGIAAGLLVLFFALNVSQGALRWVGFFGAISAGVAIALVSVVFAVDGVANKQAADAWASAPTAEQATRFASAQALRWLEWGTTSYQDFLLGLALVLFAIVIVGTARVKRTIGYLMGVSGLAFLVQGWVIGTTGFTSATTVPTAAGYGLLFASMIWLLIVAWLGKESVQAVPT